MATTGGTRWRWRCHARIAPARRTRVALPLADRSLHIRSSETLQGDEPAIVRRARAAG